MDSASERLPDALQSLLRQLDASRLNSIDLAEQLATALPKAELHLHIEGTLEPRLALALARENGVQALLDEYADSEEVLRAAYRFSSLDSFLRVYYECMAVLRTEADFARLATEYLERAHADRVRHAEVFFDAQAHARRGVSLATVVRGLRAGVHSAQQRFGMCTRLILCIQREYPEGDALRTLHEALAFRDDIDGIGLDGSEVANPPERFSRAFALARAHGWRVVAHAGEEAPSNYIWTALNALQVQRIDHGVRCLDDPQLVQHLRRIQVPLTVCPLSNIQLRVCADLSVHPLRRLLDEQLCVSVHSDDPAYFGGYLNDNLLAVVRHTGVRAADILRLLHASFRASFPCERARQHEAELIADAQRVVARYRPADREASDGATTACER